MIDASAVLQTAIIKLLREAANVTALVAADRILASPPDGGAGNLITLGPSDAIAFHRAEYGGSSTFLQIDVWTQAADDARDHVWRARQISEQVSRALHCAEFEIDDWHVFGPLSVDTSRMLTDPGGLTAHGVLTIRADLAPAQLALEGD